MFKNLEIGLQEKGGLQENTPSEMNSVMSLVYIPLKTSRNMLVTGDLIEKVLQYLLFKMKKYARDIVSQKLVTTTLFLLLGKKIYSNNNRGGLNVFVFLHLEIDFRILSPFVKLLCCLISKRL